MQPVAIDYGRARAEVAWFGEESAWANVRRVLGRPGRFDVRLTFLAAFDAPADRKALARAARAAIEAALYGGDARASDHAPPYL